jgi:hypothetical protein
MIDDHTQGEHANHYPTNAVVILEGGSMSENFEGRQIKDRLSQMFEKQLKLTICNIVKHCSDSGTVNSVAIPVLGIGK